MAACGSCAAPLGSSYDQTCRRCGWDAQVGFRRCVKCKGVVTLWEAAGFGPISGVVGVAGIILWRFLGVLLGGAIVCAIGSLCGLLSSLLMAQACGQCRYRPPRAQLLPEERRTLRLRRLGFLIGSVVLGVGAVVLFLLFAAAVSNRY